MPYIIYQTLSGEYDNEKVTETVNSYIRKNEILETEAIDFHSDIFDSYESAERYLQSFDTAGGNHAVKYKDNIRNSKAYLKVCEHYDKAIQKYNELLQHYYFENYNRTYIECKKCGSKLNTTYMKHKKAVSCLVCKAELRPQVWFNELNIAKERVNYCRDKKQNMERIEKIKINDGIYIFWLVKYAVLENYQEGTKIYEM